jgi:hypothetical protein
MSVHVVEIENSDIDYAHEISAILNMYLVLPDDCKIKVTHIENG